MTATDTPVNNGVNVEALLGRTSGADRNARGRTVPVAGNV